MFEDGQPKHTVKQERTTWRDYELSQRHRKWGYGVPAYDIDFLLCEVDKGEPTALIEYKSEWSSPQFPSHPSYLTLSSLGDRSKLPVFVVRYAQDFSWFKIVPLNRFAKLILPERCTVNERLYVTWLWNLRGLQPPESIFTALDSAI
ncbi:MAG: hypothetical protein AB7F86_09640 [Bdellovibrionales bacterium]